MQDVDWPRWAHSKPLTDNHKNCQVIDLEFVAGDTKAGGLGSIAVKCKACGVYRTLESITAPNILKSTGASCSGKQPWQSGIRSVDCKSELHVVQRGAGNVYYPVVKSSITIPPESRFFKTDRGGNETAIRDHPYFNLTQGDNLEFVNHIFSQIASELKCSVDEVRLVSNAQNVPQEGTNVDINTEEWEALISEIKEVDDRDKFVTRHIPFSNSNNVSEFLNCIGKVVSVIKLREVRALAGFYRYHPAGTYGTGEIRNSIKPDIDGTLTWLPAVEVYGEGIFISLNESSLKIWEKKQNIIDRVNTIQKRAAKSSLEYFLPEITPRFVLLHTLAHILIRRLAFECGYSSASLRERIYAKQCDENHENNQAGILIYTAAGDSEGTLGGLSRQAEGTRFIDMLLSGLQDAANCSADPICMESKGQGLDTLNLAACHACSLVAETSCTFFNSALDRALLIGDKEFSGFFTQLLSSALEKTVYYTHQDETTNF